MKDLKHPAKPLFQNGSDVDVTILTNEEYDEEDYHSSLFYLMYWNLARCRLGLLPACSLFRLVPCIGLLRA